MAKGVREFPQHSISPFFKGLYQVKTRNKIFAVGKQYSLFDHKSGEIEVDKTAFIGMRKVVDKGEFVKIYRGAIQALFDLSLKAQRVYGYFMEAMRINDHAVLFDQTECMEHTGYKSKVSVWEGVAELLEKGFIARATKQNVFFVNPEISFNGDRLVQFNEWILRGSEAHKELKSKEQDYDEKQLTIQDELLSRPVK